MAETGRSRRKKLVEKDVLERAARIFARKGFAGTSLQEVADALDVSRASLYYYFKDKDALMRALVEDVTIIAAKEVAEVLGRPHPSCTDALFALIGHRCRSLLDRRHRFRLLVTGEHELRGDLSDVHLEARRQVHQAHVALIEKGIAAGEFRPVDPRVAALVLLGMVNWAAWWFCPGGSLTGEEIATLIADMAVAALAVPDRDRAGERTVAATLEALEADMALLRRLLGNGAAREPSG